MGFPPETSQTCWRKESASPSPPSAPSTCTWSWSNVRKTKRKQLKVKNIPWKQRTFFFLWPHTHVDIRPVVAPGRGLLAVTWPLATAARGVRVCVRGRGAGVTWCQLYLSLVLQLPGCSPWASLSPWLVLTRWTCANLASSTLHQRRSFSPASYPTLFFFTPINAHANVLII